MPFLNSSHLIAYFYVNIGKIGWKEPKLCLVWHAKMWIWSTKCLVWHVLVSKINFWHHFWKINFFEKSRKFLRFFKNWIHLFSKIFTKEISKKNLIEDFWARPHNPISKILLSKDSGDQDLSIDTTFSLKELWEHASKSSSKFFLLISLVKIFEIEIIKIEIGFFKNENFLS